MDDRDRALLAEIAERDRVFVRPATGNIRAHPDDPWAGVFDRRELLRIVGQLEAEDRELVAAAQWIVRIYADNVVIKARDLALWEDLDRLRRALFVPAAEDLADDAAAAEATKGRWR